MQLQFGKWNRGRHREFRRDEIGRRDGRLVEMEAKDSFDGVEMDWWWLVCQERPAESSKISISAEINGIR